MSIDPSVVPPDWTVNQPEPPSEPAIEELRRWSAEWLGVTRNWNWWDYQKDGEHRSWDEWHPDENIGQAWLLVEKIHALDNGWRFYIDQERNDDFNVLFGHSDYDAVGAFGIPFKDIPHGIVLAAYRTTQGKETQ